MHKNIIGNFFGDFPGMCECEGKTEQPHKEMIIKRPEGRLIIVHYDVAKKTIDGTLIHSFYTLIMVANYIT